MMNFRKIAAASKGELLLRYFTEDTPEPIHPGALDEAGRQLEEGGRLKAIGKRLPREAVNAESIGLLAFRAGGAEQFRDAIDRAIRTPEGTTIWYLRVIHHLAQDDEVWTLDIRGEEWGEVDFPADVDRARELTARWDAEEKARAA